MSHKDHKQHNQTSSEQGMLGSYIKGFILSLLFTLNAYYLVVNKPVKGTALLTTILVFAVLQMAVQIFFFLHLGRGPKPLYNIVFFAGTVSLIMVVVIGSIFITDNLNYNMSSGQMTTRLAESEAIAQVGKLKTGACDQIHTNHKVVISNRVVSPSVTYASLCDTLTFINLDDATREIAFGPHPKHLIYGGQVEVVVRKSYPKVLTLNQSGSYRFHDHIDPSVAGFFIVSDK